MMLKIVCNIVEEYVTGLAGILDLEPPPVVVAPPGNKPEESF